jgi:hypothetical protein
MAIVQDPRLKSIMKQAILQVMYGPFEERRVNALKEILQRNCVLQHSQVPAFTFKGVAYGDPQMHGIIRPKLHPDLQYTMAMWVDEGKEVFNNERPYIENFITLILNSSPSAEDWLALLPETFQGPVRYLMDYYTSIPSCLNKDQIAAIVDEQAPAILLMKRRMAINLLQN